MTVANCINCGGLIFKEREWASFVFEEFNFNVECDPRECKKCTTRFYKALLNRNFDCTSLKAGKREIDISKYCHFFKEKHQGKKFTELTYLLYASSVLRTEPKGNWALVKSGYFLNPTLQNQTLFFSNEENAVFFAKNCFSCSIGEIIIIKIEACTIPRDNHLN
jgi:hypothetical protein